MKRSSRGMVGSLLSLHGQRIIANPLFEIPRTREYIGRMTLLGNFDDSSALQLEDVFVPEQEHFARALAELAVVEPIVVWLPRNLCDVEISGNAQLVANP